MIDTLKSAIEEELRKAYERGVQDGMKREHAMWQLARIGQEIEHVQTVNISSERVQKTGENEHEPVAWMWDINNGAGYSSRGIGFEQTNIPFVKHTPLYAVLPQPEPVAWVDTLNKARPDCVTDFKYLSAAQVNSGEHLKYIPLYTAALAQPEKTDMQIGLTYEEANAPQPVLKERNKC